MSIRVVQANPAMDRIELVERLEVGSVLRSVDVRVVAGGKGLNVARGVRKLGHEVSVYGFAGGLIGGFIRNACVRMGALDRHVAIAGETRVCTVIVEQAGRSTVLNEPGPTVTAAEARQLLDEVAADSDAGDLVVMAGSLPPGLGDDFYAQLVRAVQARGARAIVDTSGRPLTAALKARPWMVKANLRELTEAGVTTTKDGLSKRTGAGNEWIVATAGSAGATVAHAGETWQITVPSVEVVNSTGSGDVFLAGTVVRLASGDEVPEALRFGAACAVGSVLAIEPEVPEAGVVQRMLGSVSVSEA